MPKWPCLITRWVTIDAKLDALVKYAKNAVETRGHVSEDVLEAFFAAGWTEENLVDTILVIADQTFTNYLHGATKVPVDWPAIPKLDVGWLYRGECGGAP